MIAIYYAGETYEYEESLSEDEVANYLAQITYVGKWNELSIDHRNELVKMARNSLRKQIAEQRSNRGISGSF